MNFLQPRVETLQLPLELTLEKFIRRMAPTTRNTDRNNDVNDINVPVNDQAESSNANVNMTPEAMAQFFRAMFASMGNMPPLP